MGDSQHHLKKAIASLMQYTPKPQAKIITANEIRQPRHPNEAVIEVSVSGGGCLIILLL